jgi:hypothetical protein
VQSWIEQFDDAFGIRMERITANRWGAQAEMILSNWQFVQQQQRPPPPSLPHTPSVWKVSTLSTNPLVSNPYPSVAPLNELTVPPASVKADLDGDPSSLNGSRPIPGNTQTPPKSTASTTPSPHKSLPSLKASGLLDWNMSPDRGSDAISTDSARTMPVGLDWLANESRDR